MTTAIMSSEEVKAVHSGDATPPVEAVDPNKDTGQRDFSVFTVSQKRWIVAAGSLAAFFSPLSSSIYFPALDTVAKALGVTVTKVNLTVTTYLDRASDSAGIAPMLIAGFSDTAGRRPAYIICFTIYVAANLGLGLQNSYAALLVLRCIQSAGSSGTVALANGLVGDLVTSAERGSYIAFASLGGMLGPSLSPIIGGLISQYLDWHWLFWFLLILSGVYATLLFLFLPETCRKVVGDGSIPPPPMNASVTDCIRHRKRKRRGAAVTEEEINEARKTYAFRFPSPLPTLKVVTDLETGAILLVTGLMYAGFYAVMTGATASFHNVYHFNNIQTALMYLPLGWGGSLRLSRRDVWWTGIIADLSHFNIERARLEIGLPSYYLSTICIIAYGWVMGRKVNLAAPVILLFISGWSLNATSQVLNALMVDIWPGQSAAATAANNLMRCELGAAASAVINPMQEAMGWGLAYTTLSLISIAASPILWLMAHKGMKWRQRRTEKEKERERAKDESKVEVK
ncbi:uncharacterized protein N7477_002203 [Penicillium maclennaniae]|uniref:uncharacterized protein n=1 Tax=Penicillium maclennaniae TaxID=1343394 RepID=UPI00253FFF8B|nr:uncharacterized protein N7477_002203 [Penicillium maclennaniae]KAJ5676570.1 hypothetical protein N7477_002203 [Penicillium maclennaniae]